MATSVSLAGQYQLIVLGHETDSWVAQCTARLDGALATGFAHLGDNPKKFLAQFQSGDATRVVDRKMPSVGVFFGRVKSPRLPAADTNRLQDLMADGNLIIPVVQEIDYFTELVPADIVHLNGISIADCGADFERLAARVLEGFDLLRETRRLFISYRRNETSGVAAQLYEALDASGFDVFLDTHGTLRPGEPFQEILWHRLADTDVAVLLDSPGFMASRWTEEELARANTSNIQILQVLWPGQPDGAPAAFSTFHPLVGSDFASSVTLGAFARLRNEAVGTILDAVESLRARAIGARHSFLVREFIQEARRASLDVRVTLRRAIVVSGHGGDPILVQPAVGVPDAIRYEALDVLRSEESGNGRNYAIPPILLYDQTGLRARWLDHLKWLNGNLATVRSLSLVDAQSWLDGLKGEASTGGSRP